jgi:iron-regulated transporter 1
MYEFAVGLLLIAVWPDTLALAAFYGLAISVAKVLGGAPIGDWVDHTQR